MRFQRVVRAQVGFLFAVGGASGVAVVVTACRDAPVEEPAEAGPDDGNEKEPEEETPRPERDSGGREDAGPVDAARCDLDADFTGNVRDASIADGQSTTGFCLGCAKRTCKDPIGACNVNCDCQGVAAPAFECFAASAGSDRCAGSFREAGVETLGRAIFSCSRTSCAEACQVNPFADGG